MTRSPDNLKGNRALQAHRQNLLRWAARRDRVIHPKRGRPFKVVPTKTRLECNAQLMVNLCREVSPPTCACVVFGLVGGPFWWVARGDQGQEAALDGQATLAEDSEDAATGGCHYSGAAVAAPTATAAASANFGGNRAVPLRWVGLFQIREMESGSAMARTL